MSEDRVRVLIADEQAKVRFALRVLLERQAEIEVVGEASSVSALVQQAKATRPTLLLLDWGLPGLSTAHSMRAIRQLDPSLKVIVLSGRPEAGREAMLAGADGFVNKTDAPEELLTVVQSCQPGRAHRSGEERP